MTFAGFHKEDAWTLEVFFHPRSDKHGPKGWYWWPRDPFQPDPGIDPEPSGPFDTAMDAYLDATDYAA